MKFSDKLPKLRKENNITQEQLADMLGVSRQAVSKWESGLSIPDMEKIIEMCKIFNCPIERLLDDGVTSNTKIKQKKSFKEYLNSILDYIAKSYKMFCSMRFKEKFKCLTELLVIIALQSLIYAILGIILLNLLSNILNFLPYVFSDFVENIIIFVYVAFAIIFTFIVTLHLFNARYLNYFVFVDDKIEKTTEKEREILEKAKETIIIRDLKQHSPFLKSFVTFIIKAILVFITIPLIFSFIILIALTVFDFILLKNGLIFGGILVLLIGMLAFNYLFITFAYHYIFKLKANLKKYFIILMVSLVAIGAGSAISFSAYLTFTRIENKLEYKMTTKTLNLEGISNLYLYDLIDRDKIKIDDNIKNIELDVEYIGAEPDIYIYDSVYYDDYNAYDKHTEYSVDIYAKDDIIFYLNLMIKDFKNKNIRDYSMIKPYKIKEVRISSKNLNIIK